MADVIELPVKREPLTLKVSYKITRREEEENSIKVHVKFSDNSLEGLVWTLTKEQARLLTIGTVLTFYCTV